MGIFLGIIDIVSVTGRNSFVNFKPLHEYKNGAFSYLSYGDRKELLPETLPEIGLYNVNFYSSNDAIIPEHQFERNEFVLFEFETEMLELNYNSSGKINKTAYKFDIASEESWRVYRLSDIGYYPIVYSEHFSSNWRRNQIITLDTDLVLFEGQEVVLQISENSAIGPLPVDWRSYDSKFIIKTNYESRKYIIPGLRYKKSISENVVELGTKGYERPYIKVGDAVCEKYFEDVMSKEAMLQSFQGVLGDAKIVDGKLDLSDIDGLLKQYRESALVGEGVPEEVQRCRQETLKSILTSESSLGETVDYISEAIVALLLKKHDTEVVSDLIEHISNNPEFMSKIRQFSFINERIAAKEAELQAKTEELEALEALAEEKRAAEVALTVIEGYEAEIEEIQKSKEKIEVELLAAEQRLSEVNNGLSLTDLLEQLTAEVDFKERRERELDGKLKKIEERLDNIFSNRTERAMDLAFDGMLSSRMLRQAAEWDKNQAVKNYNAVIESYQLLITDTLSSKDLVAHICEQVQKYRPDYSRNTILNIVICIVQGFLTVFTGEPGTGKTSICNIIANTLGLTLPQVVLPKNIDGIDVNRYIPVSVERGWTTKRDFIGYYNPLSHEFDKSNRKMFDCLNVLHCEATKRNSDLPYLVLLDEANLSPMEYYWADFMNVCDGENNEINLGDEMCFQLPDGLRFVATTNNDHTTESLSPRLIDRAWVIRLPVAKAGTAKATKLVFDGVKPLTWSSLRGAFDVSDNESMEMTGKAKEIYDAVTSMLRNARIAVSPRADVAIRRYWVVAQKLFEDEPEYAQDASVTALDYAICQRVLPHVDGSGEGFRNALQDLVVMFEKHNLHRSEEMLSEIIRRGDEQMFYYQFFA